HVTTCPPTGSRAPGAPVEVTQERVAEHAEADAARPPLGCDRRALREGWLPGREHRSGQLSCTCLERDFLRAVRRQGRLPAGRLSGRRRARVRTNADREAGGR